MKNSRRWLVWSKYGGRCFYCGCVLEVDEIEIDHAYPKSKGGPDHFDNFVAACGPCNRRKRTTPINKFVTKAKLDEFMQIREQFIQTRRKLASTRNKKDDNLPALPFQKWVNGHPSYARAMIYRGVVDGKGCIHLLDGDDLKPPKGCVVSITWEGPFEFLGGMWQVKST